jgi:hypothetical protein
MFARPLAVALRMPVPEAVMGSLTTDGILLTRWTTLSAR